MAAKPDSQTALYPAFDEPLDKDLLIKSAEALNIDKKQVYVASLGRVGYSGARLYKCFSPGSKIFVVKIDKRKAIKKEHEAMGKIKPYYSIPEYLVPADLGKGPDTALPMAFAGEKHELGALKKVMEFQDFAYSEKYGLTRTLRILKRLLEGLIISVEADNPTAEVVPIDTLSRYISRNEDVHKSIIERTEAQKRVLTSMLGVSTKLGSGQIRLADNAIIDPRVFLRDRRLCKKLTMHVGPVHGDFHPKNVMIDAGGGDAPHFIDFAWANPSLPRLVDYALMECSLRFMLFPKSVDWALQRQVDNLLLNENGYREISKRTERVVLQKTYSRLGYMLGVLRQAARRHINRDNWFLEYLIVQFLILYGLMKYSGYQTVPNVLALGMIGQKLNRALK